MSRRRSVALLLVALSVAVFAPAAAQEDGGRSVRELKEGYDEAVAEEAEVLEAYAASQQRVEELRLQAADLDNQISAARQRLAVAQAALDKAQAQAQLARRRLDGVTESLQAAEDKLEAQAVEAYVGGGSHSELTIFLSVDSFEQLQSSLRYSRAVLADQHATVEERDRLRRESAARSRALDEASRRAVGARDAVQQEEADLSSRRQELAGVQSEAEAELARQVGFLAEVQERKLVYLQRLAALASESDSIAAMLRDRQGGQTVRGDMTFADPLPVMVITSGFGPRVHPIFGDVRTHNGLDLDADTGAPIHAAAPGVVVWASERGGYGNCVIIDHGGQLATLYGHQSRIMVRVGQTVEVGDVIGAVGSTGYSTGSHLHFEIRVFGNPTDPLPFLPR